MSADDRHRADREESLGADERRVQTQLRTVATPEARAEFRSRLRAQFVRGQFEAAEKRVVPRATPRPRRPRRRWLAWSLPLAAAVAWLLVLPSLDAGASWQVMRAGTPTVTLDGKVYPCDDLSPLQAALHPGCRITLTTDGRFEVQDPGRLTLQLNGAVEFTLPTVSRRSLGRTLESEIAGEGTLRVATGPQFAGQRYRIRGEGVDLTVTGTTFTVIRSQDETCICVLDGQVVATLADGSVRTIDGGGRLTIQRSSGSVEEGPMRADEHDELRRLRGRVGELG